jgi:hypothetical protein
LSRTPSTALKIAVLAPIPKPNVMIETAAKPGEDRRRRKAERTSERK